MALQKTGCLLGNLTPIRGSTLRQFFDAVSVRVYLKDNKVDYITIPNSIRNKEAHVTKINCYESERKVVILRLTDRLGSKIFNYKASTAADRKLFLGELEGKKLLKFLVDHASDLYAKDIWRDNGSNLKEFLEPIVTDWDDIVTKPHNRIAPIPSGVESYDFHPAKPSTLRRLAEAEYYYSNH